MLCRADVRSLGAGTELASLLSTGANLPGLQVLFPQINEQVLSDMFVLAVGLMIDLVQLGLASRFLSDPHRMQRLFSGWCVSVLLCSVFQ